jgi:hypothetical protein
MKTYRVQMTDDRIIEVQAAEDASDDEIIAMAEQKQQTAPVAPDDTAMNQARAVGVMAGAANALGPSVPGAISGTVSAVRDIGQAKAPPVLETKYPNLQGLDITQNQNTLQSVERQLAEQRTLLARETDPSGRRMLQDNITRLQEQADEARRGVQMGRSGAMQNLRNAPVTQMPGRAEELAATYAPKTAAAGGKLARFAGRALGPYGAITSAQDTAQRFNQAQSPMDYVQSGISALGTLGYGVGTVPTPITKPVGLAIGGATDLANMGIDYIRQIREEAARRAMQGQR